MNFRGALVAVSLALAACAAAPSAPLASKAEFDLVNRLTWGATPAELRDIQRVGAAAWIDAQLGPERPLPAEVQMQIDALRLTDGPIGAKVVEIDALRAASVKLADPEARKATYGQYRNGWTQLQMQAVTRSLLRDLASRDQLRQQLTWFWFNHFNIRGSAGTTAMLVGDYEETIRTRALGKFCDLVGATLRHPAMIVYLNNAANTVEKGNENYARELMELHTLGVGTGYTQGDVQVLARVLTGVGVDLKRWPPPSPPPGGKRDGLFVFEPARHDDTGKTLLGRKLRGKGFAEVEEATALLCRHPATARRVATRLAKYFVADTPAPALIDRLAATFSKTDGDIAVVMRALIASPEFVASLGKLYKDPQHYVLSAARLALDGKPPQDPVHLGRMLGALGQARYARATPDGYPLESDNWNASGQLASRFQIAGRFGRGVPALLGEGDPAIIDLKAAHAAGIYLNLAPATRQVLGEARVAAEWTALFLSSPEFMRR